MNDAKKKRFAPSIFAADLFNLEKAVGLFKRAGVDSIHFDVMDNHFVPNISFGAKLIEDVASRSGLPSDVHLMIELDDDKRAEHFLKLPVEHITIHFEAQSGKPSGLLDKIRNSGKTAGISIKPDTPVESVRFLLKQIDQILLMSVDPGYSGQKFMQDSLERLMQLKNIIGNHPVSIQVDGGVNRENVKKVLEAGADYIVMGTAFYKDKNPEELVRMVHES